MSASSAAAIPGSLARSISPSAAFAPSCWRRGASATAPPAATAGSSAAGTGATSSTLERELGADAGAPPLVARRGGEGAGARTHRPPRHRLRPEAGHRHRRAPPAPRPGAGPRGGVSSQTIRLRRDRGAGPRRGSARRWTRRISGAAFWTGARATSTRSTMRQGLARAAADAGVDIREGSQPCRGSRRARPAGFRGRPAHGHGGRGRARLQRLSRCAGPRHRRPHHADQQLHPGDRAPRRGPRARADPERCRRGRYALRGELFSALGRWAPALRRRRDQQAGVSSPTPARSSAATCCASSPSSPMCASTMSGAGPLPSPGPGCRASAGSRRRALLRARLLRPRRGAGHALAAR